MNRWWPVLFLAGVLLLGFSDNSRGGNYLRIVSPDHEQTFAYGSEKNRIWFARGKDQHLALRLDFTNDPYVDRVNPRQYDNFIFSFPGVTLGADGRTFNYHMGKGRLIPIAERKSGFLGIEDIRLLPNVALIVHKPHGFLTVELVIDG